jgi:hypothetical protein
MSNRNQISPSQYIDHFLKRCGLVGQQKDEIFWRVLEKNLDL